MAKEADFKGLLERACKETGKAEKEVLKMVEGKKAKFSGLLTDSGAMFMVAKELGLEIDLQKQAEKKVKIAGLEDGLKGLEMPVRVLHVYSPKTYEKDKKKGQYCRLLVGDETGEISLTLWGDDVKRIEKEKIERGAALLLKNASVSSYQGKLQLGVPFGGRIELKPELGEGTLPKPENIAVKVSDLGEGMENIDVFARVIRVFEVNEFQREGETRKVVNFLIGDGSGEIRATAWNDLAERVNALEPGELVKIEGGYTKKGLKALELHLGWNSRVLIDPVVGFKIPELSELSKAGFERQRIGGLNEGALAEVFGTITRLNKGNLLFATCPKCGGKPVPEANGLVCEKCGQVKEPKNRLVITATIDDGTGAIRASAFGRNAERLLEHSTREIEKELGEKTPGEVIAELSQNVVGNSLLFSGRVKKNAINPEELEFSVSTVRSADFRQEAERALGRLKAKGV